MSERGPGRPVRIDKDYVVELRQQGLSQKAIAEKLNTTRGYIAKILCDRGVRLPASKPGRNPNAIANAQKVLDHIVKNGGTLRNALLALDLDVCDATVRSLAVEQGIRIADYRYLGQKRRNWVIHKPGYRKIDTHHNFLPVQCTECGHETELHYLKFQSARPGACPNCGAT